MTRKQKRWLVGTAAGLGELLCGIASRHTPLPWAFVIVGATGLWLYLGGCVFLDGPDTSRESRVLVKGKMKTASGTPLLFIGLSGKGAPVRITARQMAVFGLPELEVLICHGSTLTEILDAVEADAAEGLTE
jgi:hypothetical protein